MNSQKRKVVNKITLSDIEREIKRALSNREVSAILDLPQRQDAVPNLSHPASLGQDFTPSPSRIVRPLADNAPSKAIARQ